MNFNKSSNEYDDNIKKLNNKILGSKLLSYTGVTGMLISTLSFNNNVKKYKFLVPHHIQKRLLVISTFSTYLCLGSMMISDHYRYKLKQLQNNINQ